MADPPPDVERSRKQELLSSATKRVVRNGLPPREALAIVNARSDLKITNAELSRALGPLVENDAADLHKAEIELREEAEQKGLDAAAIAARTVDVHGLSIPKSFVQSHPHWTASYERLSHFQSKVAANVEKKREIPANDIPQDPDSSAANSANENAKRHCTEQNYKNAWKEATTLFHQKKEGDTTDPRVKLTHEQIVKSLNEKWHLGGEGKENSREKNMLAVSTLRRAVKKGNFGVSPKKKGK
eukprot:scaffold248488_cov98-Cyclotella_meneghiniana.AAC.1